jgi:hypothetical protein
VQPEQEHRHTAGRARAQQVVELAKQRFVGAERVALVGQGPCARAKLLDPGGQPRREPGALALGRRRTRAVGYRRAELVQADQRSLDVTQRAGQIASPALGSRIESVAQRTDRRGVDEVDDAVILQRADRRGEPPARAEHADPRHLDDHDDTASAFAILASSTASVRAMVARTSPFMAS